MNPIYDLLDASRHELRQRIVHGHPVDPRALEGYAYRGVSLGLPRVVEKLTWKTFQKTFYREPRTGRLLGWNVRLEQDGIEAPSRPKMKGCEPITTWFYEVVEPRGIAYPPGFDRGLLIDYSRGVGNAPFESIRLTKDPLVALEEGSADFLIGVSYLALGKLTLETPTYFALVRDHPIDFVPRPIRELSEIDPRRHGKRKARG